MSTVTASVSLALPVNDGVVSFDGVFGWSRVTVGEAVSIVNATAALPVSPRLVCSATAVYFPSARGDSGAVSQVPKSGAITFSVCAFGPVLPPSWIVSVIPSRVSLLVPLNGSIWLLVELPDTGCSITTSGEAAAATAGSIASAPSATATACPTCLRACIEDPLLKSLPSHPPLSRGRSSVGSSGSVYADVDDRHNLTRI